MSKKVIEGIKLISYRSAGVNNPDDLSLPFRLEINLRPPSFMEFAFVSLFGGSDIVVVRGETLEALQQFVTINNHRTHPHLRHLTITGPDGVVEEFRPEPQPSLL